MTQSIFRHTPLACCARSSESGTRSAILEEYGKLFWNFVLYSRRENDHEEDWDGQVVPNRQGVWLHCPG